MYCFNVLCGNWVYPSNNSSSGVRYETNYPVVAEIFLTKSQSESGVNPEGYIWSHLTGPRFLKVVVTDDNVLHIDALCNCAEPHFEEDLDISIPFNPEELCRFKTLWSMFPFGITEEVIPIPNKDIRIDQGIWDAVFFTSVLFQAHKNNLELGDDIVFRDATIPEVEQLGGWNNPSDPKERDIISRIANLEYLKTL